VAAAAAAGGGGGSSEPQQLDEFGRDVSLMRRKELERGAGRRQQLVGRLLAELQALQQGGCWCRRGVCGVGLAVMPWSAVTGAPHTTLTCA
jgi:hypothetical protein